MTEKHPRQSGDKQGLEIVVLFTTLESTTVALKIAGTLAGGLPRRIQLLCTRVIPIGADMPGPAEAGLAQSWLNRICSELPSDPEVETRVRLCFCRDEFEAVRTLVQPQSLIVIGLSRHWWRRRWKALAFRLRRAGNRVLVV